MRLDRLASMLLPGMDRALSAMTGESREALASLLAIPGAEIELSANGAGLYTTQGARWLAWKQKNIQEAWEALATEEVIPEHWASSLYGGFACPVCLPDIAAVALIERRREYVRPKRQQCPVCRDESITSTPTTRGQILCVASDPKAVIAFVLSSVADLYEKGMSLEEPDIIISNPKKPMALRLMALHKTNEKRIGLLELALSFEQKKP